MSELAGIQVDPEYELIAPIYVTLGDGSAHVDAFTELPEFDWRTLCQDKQRMVSLIREPLQLYWAELNVSRQIDLKTALQYLLNVDQHVPYETSKIFPELRSKCKGIGHRLFRTFQDTIQPFDNYVLCQWMWEVLFGDEAWTTDISAWRLVNKVEVARTQPM